MSNQGCKGSRLFPGYVCENVLIWMRNVSGNGRLRRSITGPASVIMDVHAATLVSCFIQEVLRG